MSKKILLIDGNSMANRAFYATMGRMMKTPTGIRTQNSRRFNNAVPYNKRIIKNDEYSYSSKRWNRSR